ncbi:MAG: DinB family protein [Acidimicrobiia bacterium]|nr:DinB family protein [Acidimicrobiia bacterium]
MTSDLLSSLDFSKASEPSPDLAMRDLLIAWLDYQRQEFIRKLRALTPDQVVQWSVPPVELSVLGLVRHMQQMEHVYLAWGLGGGERHMIYGEDDYAGGSVESIEEDLGRYLAEVERADAALAALESLDEVGLGHGRPLGATLIKMIHEYTLHSGQAHMLRFAALGEIIR